MTSLLSIGTLFRGRYEVIQPLGEGVLGTSYRVHDKQNGRLLILRVFDRRPDGPKPGSDFIAGLTGLMKLAHPYLAGILEKGEEQGSPYVLSEYVDGLPLHVLLERKLQNKLTFSLMEIRPLVTQIGEALTYLHAQTFHGSLRAGNIILLPEFLKITDFGFVALLPPAARRQLASARPDLAWPPEYERGGGDARSDIFSFGALIFELLYGTPPRSVDDCRGLESMIHPSFVEVLRRALHPDPASRQKDVQQFLQDFLEAYESSESVMRRPRPRRPRYQVRPALSGSEENRSKLDRALREPPPPAPPPAPSPEPVPPATYQFPDTDAGAAGFSGVAVASILLRWFLAGFLFFVPVMGFYGARYYLFPLSTSACPPGMILIPAAQVIIGSREDDPNRNVLDLKPRLKDVPAFCIDRYEYPNGKGQMPNSGLSWDGAGTLCRKQGKSLCSESQWERACRGPEQWAYPYGNVPDATRCNLEGRNGEDMAVRPSGSFPECLTPYGVADMAGNVAEWIDPEGQISDPSHAVNKGGGAQRPLWASRCAARNESPRALSDVYIGVRCCVSPSM